MADLEFAAIGGQLEIRQEGGRGVISGTFPYGSLATIADRGAVRKETIMPRAFRFAIEARERPIDLLVGHSFNRPLARRQAGTLVIEDGPDAVRFEAQLPANPPSYVVDAERAIDAGLMTGLSPGFRVPPRAAVPGAEDTIPEPGNPGVMVRRVHAAVLREFSIVTAGAYLDAAVDLRAEEMAGNNAVLMLPRAGTLWL